MKETLKIGLLTASLNNGNMGCNALAYSAITLLEEVSKKIGISFQYVFFSSFSKEALKLYPLLKNLRINVVESAISLRLKLGFLLARDPLKIQHFYKCFDRCDIFFEISGGDSFSDIYGVNRLKSEFAYHRLIMKKKKKLVMLPQTIGPFSRDAAKKIAATSLSYSSLTFARDPISFEMSKNYAESDRIEQTIDMAFFMEYMQRRRSVDRLRIGINPSGLLWNGGYTGDNQFNLAVDYQELLFSIIRMLEEQGVQIVLIPHVLIGPTYHVEDDYKVCRLLKEQFPACCIAPFFYSPIEAKSYISGIDLLIGSRMHCCIAAYSAGVPIIPMAYSRKFMGLFKHELNYHFGIELMNGTIESIVEDVKKTMKQLNDIQREMPERVKRIATYRTPLVNRLSVLFNSVFAG